MIFLICGIIIGLVMGLTGAGGALVAIPLFMQFLAMGLKQASVYSLLAVVMASFLNYLAQRKFTKYKTALLIVFFSALGSFFSAPYKKLLPDFVMVILLILVSLFALYSVWLGKKGGTESVSPEKNNYVLSFFTGIFLGVLTTFTGLGGGVLMLPVFLKFYHLDQNHAVATSLLAVCLSSLFSLGVQMYNGFSISFDVGLLFLILGIFAAALSLKFLLEKFPSPFILTLRKIVFTLVVFLAIVKIL